MSFRASASCVALAMAACGQSTALRPDAAQGTVDARPGKDGPASDGPASEAPTLTMVVPARGIVTTTLTLTGSGFGDVQGGSTVAIGGATATVTSWSATSIVTAIPDVLPGDAA